MRRILSSCAARLRTVLLRLYQLVKQRRYRGFSCELNYIYSGCPGSDSLIVVFSGCTGPGIPARYNYMRTLKDIPCHKLFILDDFGLDRRGGYYLGAYPEFLFEKATMALIGETVTRRSIKTCYFAGSSKGGWAALNFGAKLSLPVKKYVIAGAPQYLLGQYLYHPANRITFDGICGEHEAAEVVAALDRHLPDAIRTGSGGGNRPHVYLHYSSREHTYEEHIVHLIGALKENGYPLTEDVAAYTDHTAVAAHYPPFLLRTLKERMDAQSGILT